MSLRLTPGEISDVIFDKDGCLFDSNYSHIGQNIADAQLSKVMDKLANMSDEELVEEIAIKLSENYPGLEGAWDFLEEEGKELFRKDARQISALFQERLGKYIEALLKAVEIIKSWHNMGAQDKLTKENIEYMWKIYYEKSPEMKIIRELLKEKNDTRG